MKSIFLISMRCSHNDDLFNEFDFVKNLAGEKVILFGNRLNTYSFPNFPYPQYEDGLITFTTDLNPNRFFTEEEYKKERSIFLKEHPNLNLPQFNELESFKNLCYLQHQSDPDFYCFRAMESDFDKELKKNYLQNCIDYLEKKLKKQNITEFSLYLIIHAQDIHQSSLKNDFSPKHIEKFNEENTISEFMKERLRVAVFSHDAGDRVYNQIGEIYEKVDTTDFRNFIHNEFLIMDGADKLFDPEQGLEEDHLNQLKSRL